MRTKFLSFLTGALLFTAASTVLVSASRQLVSSQLTAGPVPGVQVTVEQNPQPGYKGGRPTDDKGSALFANMEEGTYVITLKRFNKPTGAYQISVKPSRGAKVTEVWDAAKKDSHKINLKLTGDTPQMVDVTVTSVDS